MIYLKAHIHHAYQVVIAHVNFSPSISSISLVFHTKKRENVSKLFIFIFYCWYRFTCVRVKMICNWNFLVLKFVCEIDLNDLYFCKLCECYCDLIELKLSNSKIKHKIHGFFMNFSPCVISMQVTHGRNIQGWELNDICEAHSRV